MKKRILMLSVLLLLCKVSPVTAEELAGSQSRPDASGMTEIRAYVAAPEQEAPGGSDASSDEKDMPGTNKTCTLEELKTGDDGSILLSFVLMAVDGAAAAGLWIIGKNGRTNNSRIENKDEKRCLL